MKLASFNDVLFSIKVNNDLCTHSECNSPPYKISISVYVNGCLISAKFCGETDKIL